MSDHEQSSHRLRPPTVVLTRGFDPRAQAEPDEDVDLIYSRFNHPNAQILEEQIVPLETAHRPQWCSTPAWRRSTLYFSRSCDQAIRRGGPLDAQSPDGVPGDAGEPDDD
jgi:hypothetical protein